MNEAIVTTYYSNYQKMVLCGDNAVEFPARHFKQDLLKKL